MYWLINLLCIYLNTFSLLTSDLEIQHSLSPRQISPRLKILYCIVLYWFCRNMFCWHKFSCEVVLLWYIVVPRLCCYVEWFCCETLKSCDVLMFCAILLWYLTGWWARADVTGPIHSSLSRAVAPVVAWRGVIAETICKLDATATCARTRTPRTPWAPATVIGRLQQKIRDF